MASNSPPASLRYGTNLADPNCSVPSSGKIWKFGSYGAPALALWALGLPRGCSCLCGEAVIAEISSRYITPRYNLSHCNRMQFIVSCPEAPPAPVTVIAEITPHWFFAAFHCNADNGLHSYLKSDIPSNTTICKKNSLNFMKNSDLQAPRSNMNKLKAQGCLQDWNGAC